MQVLTYWIPKSGRVERLRHDPSDPLPLADDRIDSLAFDRSGTLWIGTEAGLDRRQPGGFFHFRHKAGDPQPERLPGRICRRLPSRIHQWNRR